MGDFQYRLKDGTRSQVNQENEVISQMYDDMPLPVLSLEQELQEYENLGRTDTVIKIQEELDRRKDQTQRNTAGTTL